MAAAPPADGPAVVCIGEALYDCLADQLGVPREAVTSWTPHPGGAPANVAAAAARLGARAAFVGALGADALGDGFVELLAARGVDVSGVQRVPGRPTRDVLVTRSRDGDRAFAGFGAAAPGEYADCFLAAEALPEAAIAGAAALVTGTLGLASAATGAATRRAVALAKAAPRCAVVIDVNWRPVFWDDAGAAKAVVADYVRAADVLKITDDEAEWLWGVPAAGALDAPAALLARLPAAAAGVLVSAGERGSAYAFRAGGGGAGGPEEVLTGRVPALAVDVVDTTGAGDAFLAGFVVRMVAAGGPRALAADGAALRRAVEFATACGAATCAGVGAIAPQPTAAEAEALLAAKG